MRNIEPPSREFECIKLNLIADFIMIFQLYFQVSHDKAAERQNLSTIESY